MATAIPAHAVIASFRFEDGAGNALSKLKDISKAQGLGVQNAAVLKVSADGKLRIKETADMSGGQKQRVAIARALAGEPRIILADEPTAALDSDSGRTVMEILTTLARDRGRAVVIVTHDSRVLHYGTRMVHIADGRLVEQEEGALV